ncbi:hypothetical protein [Vibrio phage LP.2]|nr:hypothetical protein [Vibrio phage LP.2]
MNKEFMVRGRFIDEDLQKISSATYDHFDCSTKNLVWRLTDRRSLSANSQVWVWAQQLAREIGDDVETIYCRMKRDQALPILLSDPVNAAVTDYILQQTNFYSIPDDKQLKLIGAMEVTRKFSTRQHNEFRDNVQIYYNSHGFNLQYMEKEND